MKNTFIIVMLGMIILTLNSCRIYTNPQGLITENEIDNLEAHYLIKIREIDKGNDSISKEPRDFFWTIDELQNYIYYTKKEASKQGKKVSGFRFYIGAKPYKNRTDQPDAITLYVLPTTKKEIGNLRAENSSNDTIIINDPNTNESMEGIKALEVAGAGKPPAK